MAMADVKGRSIIYACLMSVRAFTVADLTGITDALLDGARFGFSWF